VTAQLRTSSGIRGFALIWFGQFVSGIGSGLTTFALGVLVYERTGSATQFTLIYLSASLPGILLLPLVGALADRWDRRWTMVMGNVGAGMSKLGLAALLYTHRLEVYHVYVIVIAASTFTLFLGITYTVLTTLLVPKRHYGRASGMVQAAQAAAQILPPALGGLMLRRVSAESIVLIDVATYVVAIVTLLLVRAPRPALADGAKQPAADDAKSAADGGAKSGAERARKGPLWRESLYGWTFIKERRGLLVLLIYFAAVNLIVSSTTVLFTPMILSFAPAEVLGTILSVSGVGFLAGSLAMSIWGGPRNRVRGVLGFGLLFGVCSVVAGLRPSPPLIALGTFGMFFALPVVNGCSQAIWQRKTPANVQGRVFAVRRMIGASTIPLAYLLAGPLADRVFEPLVASGRLHTGLARVVGEGRGRGIALMFVVAGLLVMLAQAVGYFQPRLRRVEEELPDADAGPAAEVALSEA
jgi:MFS family permease